VLAKRCVWIHRESLFNFYLGTICGCFAKKGVLCWPWSPARHLTGRKSQSINTGAEVKLIEWAGRARASAENCDGAAGRFRRHLLSWACTCKWALSACAISSISCATRQWLQPVGILADNFARAAPHITRLTCPSKALYRRRNESACMLEWRAPCCNVYNRCVLLPYLYKHHIMHTFCLLCLCRGFSSQTWWCKKWCCILYTSGITLILSVESIIPHQRQTKSALL
jgi:hypothetical protein